MWLQRTIGVCVCAMWLGCGDNGGTSESNSNSNSESDSSTQATEGSSGGSMSATMSATEVTEGSASLSGTGTTEQSGSMSDSQTNGGSTVNETDSATGGSSGQDSVGGSGGSSTGGSSSSSTGEPVDCNTAKTEDECVMLGCMPVKGKPFNFDGAIWCLKDTSSYLGCIPEAVCDQVIVTVCKGQNKYQQPNGCLAPGYQECEAPPDPGMDGYPPC